MPLKIIEKSSKFITNQTKKHMEKSLKNFAMAGVLIKRFTFIRNGILMQCKPKPKEKFIIVEDYLGDRSLLWVACIEDSNELWRHNVTDIVRITYEQPIC